MSHQKGYQSIFSKRLVELWWLLDKFTSLQKPAQSFKLPLPPKASLSVWILKYWGRILDIISRSHLQFYKPASIHCSISIHKSSTLANEYRGVFLSINLLNLEKNGNKYKMTLEIETFETHHVHSNTAFLAHCRTKTSTRILNANW